MARFCATLVQRESRIPTWRVRKGTDDVDGGCPLTASLLEVAAPSEGDGAALVVTLFPLAGAAGESDTNDEPFCCCGELAIGGASRSKGEPLLDIGDSRELEPSLGTLGGREGTLLQGRFTEGLLEGEVYRDVVGARVGSLSLAAEPF
ncbi:hypothetical protein ACA910_009446 [Epithemia clementina (nom. ined.)]